MNLSKKISAMLLAVSASAVLLGGCSNKAEIGYYNHQRVMKESPKIEAVVNEANDKLRKAQEEALKFEIEQAPSMKPEEAEQKRQQLQMQLQAINQAYVGQMKQKLDVAIDDVAKAKKIDAVMANEPGARLVIYGGVDITEDLIQKLQ